MTELNGDHWHLEFMKRRGRRAPSDCSEAIPKALSPTPYDIINGEVAQREYVDKFQGFEPHRPLNLFERSAEDDEGRTFRRVRKTVSEPKISSRSGRPKVPDILSKPKLPDEVFNIRRYDHDFWSTASSIVGDTESVHTYGSVEDDFEERFHLRERQDQSRSTMPKWCQNAMGENENYESSWVQQNRYEPPKASPLRSEPQRYIQSRPQQSPPKYDDSIHDYRKYNKHTPDPPRPQRQIEHINNSRGNIDQRTFVLKDEGYSEPRYEKASSSVSQVPAYKRVCCLY